MSQCLYIVIPCYNESAVLPQTVPILCEKVSALKSMGKISSESRVLFVDDGSGDETWDLIRTYAKERPDTVTGITLAHNRGHQNALLAGLTTAIRKGDAIITMDADLQDDPAAIDEMVEKYLQGCDIVYGIRSDRKSDSFFKRFSAEAFYRLMNAMGCQTVFNHADFRLMSRRAIEALLEYKEVNLYLRGIVPMLGFHTGQVFFERKPRLAGESKYSLKKMVALAIDGITSMSVRPLRVIMLLGGLIFLISIVMIIAGLFQKTPVFAETIGKTILRSVWAIGGLILLSIGVVGEYIGKIYLETKERPRFVIETDLDDTTETND